ncbi:hypothetical protein AWENTII_006331 [Aspergillus wentii]
MRMIYAQARRVIVWLGEVLEDSDNALEVISHLGREQNILSCERIEKENHDACQRLLQRNWFGRIWVLQEVGVAQCISVMYGSVQINGHIFCEGLSKLRAPLPSYIQPVLYLIRGALFRPRYEIDSYGTLAIGELLDMYRNHNATRLHDKVYALLGLSVENADKASLKPNYDLQWNDVFKQVIMHVFPSSCSVETWPEAAVAVIKGKGWVLGYVDSVEEATSKYSCQKVNVIYNDTARSLNCEHNWGTEWTLQASAEPVQKDPIIIKLCNDRFAVVVSTAILRPDRNMGSCDVAPAQKDFPIQGSIYDFYMTWEISLADRESNSGLKDQNGLGSVAPQYKEKNCEKAKRLHAVSFIIDDIIIQMLEKDNTGNHIRYLLLHRGESLPVSEDVVKAAAANGGSIGYEIMQLLLEHQGESPLVSKDVVKAAAANGGSNGHKIIQLLLEHWGESLPISKDIVKATAINRKKGYKIMQLLLEQWGENLPVSEDVVKAAAANGYNGHEIMQLLLEYWGESLPVPEDVVKAAASNRYRHEIMQLLLEHRGESLPVSEDVVKAAAANEGYYGHEIMQLLLEHWGENLLISEDVVKAAITNRKKGYKIMQLLLEHRGENLPVSEGNVDIRSCSGS